MADIENTSITNYRQDKIHPKTLFHLKIIVDPINSFTSVNYLNLRQGNYFSIY